MASRIFWFLIAGFALIGGIILQDGNKIFSWGEEANQSIEQRIEARVDRAIDRSVDEMRVVDSDGEQVDIPVEIKRALADSVARLVKAEAELAVLQVKDASTDEVEAAQVVRDKARADVETLKAKIESQKELSDEGRQTARDEIRDDGRDEIRDAVRN